MTVQAGTPGLSGAWQEERRKTWLDQIRRIRRFLAKNPLSLIGTLIILAWTVIAIGAPWLAPRDPLGQDLAQRLLPPGPGHWLGTDPLGRDVLSRVMAGARISLPLGVLATVFTFSIGMVVGSIAGYTGGFLDEIVMRVADVFLGFPAIILAMAIAAALGTSLRNGLIAIIIVLWPKYARLVRSLVLTVRETDYVLAGRMIGASHLRILTRTILPNSLAPAIIMATLDIGNNVMIFSILSFIGLGAVPPSPEWGAMVASGSQRMDQWWLSTFPGLAIFTITMAFNFIGDALRDIMDPLLRKAA
jgi:peptide/nickel transport system permease protein